jgi:hypothetical protein
MLVVIWPDSQRLRAVISCTRLRVSSNYPKDFVSLGFFPRGIYSSLFSSLALVAGRHARRHLAWFSTASCCYKLPKTSSLQQLPERLRVSRVFFPRVHCQP